MKKRLLFGWLVFVFLLILSPLAAYALRIDNPKTVVQMVPGETYSGTIVLTNPTPEQVYIKAYLEDFSYIPPFNGEKEFFPPASLDNSASTWVSFSPQEFTIPPNSQQQVGFSIQPTEDFDTVCNSVLFFETSIGTTQDEQGKDINLLGRIGSLIFVEPKGRVKKAVFDELRGASGAIGGLIRNSGKSLIHMLGTYYLMDEQGIVKMRGELQETLLLPGNETNLTVELEKGLDPGRYTMIYTMDMEDGDMLMKEVDFTVSGSGVAKVLEVRD